MPGGVCWCVRCPVKSSSRVSARVVCLSEGRGRDGRSLCRGRTPKPKINQQSPHSSLPLPLIRYCTDWRLCLSASLYDVCMLPACLPARLPARHSDAQLHVLVLALCNSSFGQLFIYHTISRFGALVFAMIMTTRQVFSIGFSVALFGHKVCAAVEGWQGGGWRAALWLGQGGKSEGGQTGCVVLGVRVGCGNGALILVVVLVVVLVAGRCCEFAWVAGCGVPAPLPPACVAQVGPVGILGACIVFAALGYKLYVNSGNSKQQKTKKKNKQKQRREEEEGEGDQNDPHQNNAFAPGGKSKEHVD